MVQHLKNDEEILKIMSREEYMQLMHQLSEKVKTIREDREEGMYAILLRVGCNDGRNLFLWLEVKWDIIHIDDLGDGIKVSLRNAISADSKEELMGADMILDRYNEVRQKQGFEKQ